MALALVAKPPTKAPWARCMLLHGHNGDLRAEVRTDLTLDKAGRQDYRVIFDTIVQTVKEQPGGTCFDMSQKNWVLRGGVTAIKGLIHSLRALGFTFANEEVDRFLETKCNQGAFSFDPFGDAFADEDVLLKRWLSTGILDIIEEGVHRAEGQAKQGKQALVPSTNVPRQNLMRLGSSVRNPNVMARPKLNGCMVTMKKLEASSDGGCKWPVSFEGQRHSPGQYKPCLDFRPQADRAHQTNSDQTQSQEQVTSKAKAAQVGFALGSSITQKRSIGHKEQHGCSICSCSKYI